ncbi:MAG: CDP-glucose 4,6-dehydratase [Candidatus Omnitrophica bacterium]|nr:CDP-glucose 4,6-dehydratase [Candidatus Omnitrophota bacterium]
MGHSYFKNYRNKTVLITGHTGFKGSWLTLWLHHLGAKVVGYALPPPPQPNLFEILSLEKKCTHVPGNILDRDCLAAVVDQYRPNSIFHLAAQPFVRLSYRNPVETYAVNVMGTVNVLDVARYARGVQTIVAVTSDKCYENREWVYGYRESDPMGGYDPYSSSKGCAELAIAAFRRSYFMPRRSRRASVPPVVVSARAGNIIGGGDWGMDRIIPDAMRAFSARKTLVIRNPLAIRPWQYVLEPLGGYLLLGSGCLTDRKIAEAGAWNFGPAANDAITVRQLVALVQKSWGGGSVKTDTSPQVHEANYLKLDISKARSQLGWQPRYSVDEAVRRSIGWYKQYYGGAAAVDIIRRSLNEIEHYMAVCQPEKK